MWNYFKVTGEAKWTQSLILETSMSSEGTVAYINIRRQGALQQALNPDCSCRAAADCGSAWQPCVNEGCTDWDNQGRYWSLNIH